MTERKRRFSAGLWAGAAMLILASAVFEASSRQGAARPLPQAGSQGVLLRNFSGVNGPISGANARELGVGWLRMNFSWSDVEPKRGQWQWQKTDDAMNHASDMGTEMLPSLGYTALWAASTSGKQFSPPSNVQDWEDYVDHVVLRYSAAPYNVRYFQIWNEPTANAGFWLGTDQQFVDIVYLPAAKIIRNHHCNVVFGGWGQGDSLQRFNALMNYHNAWQWTDIVDAHYKTIPDFQQLYSTWVASGKCKGVWQTEVGYTSSAGFISGLYTRILAWTLQMGWKEPDEFKYLWFAGAGSGPEGEKCLINNSRPAGSQLTDQGRHLAVLNQVLGRGPLSTFSQFSTTPAVTGPAWNAWALGYQVGSNRIVINFLTDRGFYNAHPSVSVTITTSSPPSHVRLMSGLGKSWDLPSQNSGGRLQISVPWHNGFDDCPACAAIQGYLILE